MARRTAPQRGSLTTITPAPQNVGATQRGSGSDSGANAVEANGEVFDEFTKRINDSWIMERNNVQEGRDCQLFYIGGSAQWDTKAWQERTKKGRPVLTINRLPQFVKQLTGDVRKNPPSLKFLPAKGEASQEVAEAFTGLSRHIDQQSGGSACYIRALENAAITGQGFYKIALEYSSDDGFEQDIRRRPVVDPFGAMIDPYCQHIDKSDMRFAFVFEVLPLEQFQKQYPDVSPTSIPQVQAAAAQFPWRRGNTVTIAEYWRKVPETKNLYLMPNGEVLDEQMISVMPPEVQQVIAQGVEVGEVRVREVESSRVEYYIVTGSQVISGPHPWPGRYIPVCMVVGEELSVNGAITRKGMVHDARDPQRIYNYSRSASVEAVALQPKAPFVGTVKQFNGRPEWQTAGSENHAFLAYNPDPQAPGAPQRSAPAIASQGLDVQAQIANEDMKGVMGIYDASLGSRSNETSGVAIRARQNEGDTATFLYVDNLARAIGYEGKILADLIPRVYDTARQVRILKADGTAEMMEVNLHQKVPEGLPPPTDDKGKPVPLYDLSAGEYDVVVVTGPSFATQRQEAAAGMVEMVRADPRLMGIAGDLLVKNLDWPGADELAERLRKANGIPGDDDEPSPPPPPPPPDLIAKVQKTAAETDKIVAETEAVKLENATALIQLQAMGAQMAQIAQAVAAMQQLLAGGAPMPGAPMPSPGGPTPSGPPPAPDLPPMQEVGGDLPSMVDVGEMPPAPMMVDTPHGRASVMPL